MAQAGNPHYPPCTGRCCAWRGVGGWMETISGLGKISFCAWAQWCKNGQALPKGVWENVGNLSYPRNRFLPDLLGEQLQSPWELVVVDILPAPAEP